jgi:hypothetical protein
MLTLGCGKVGKRVRLTMPDGTAVWLAISRNPGPSGTSGQGRITIDAPRTVVIQREAIVPPDERPVWKAKKG